MKTEKQKEERKRYKLKYPEKIKAWKKASRKRNRNTELVYKRKWKKEKMATDPLFRLSTRIRKSIRATFDMKKPGKTLEILGCNDFQQFKDYIESRWESWMSWENYGKYNGELNYGWDLDHIIPVSSARTEVEIIKLNHYTNFQPLCSHTNRDVKRNKINFAN